MTESLTRLQIDASQSRMFFFFFFSSRRRHTRFDCDWSSDVCSSDLRDRDPTANAFYIPWGGFDFRDFVGSGTVKGRRLLPSMFFGPGGTPLSGVNRSEERRVGKECRSRWSPYH